MRCTFVAFDTANENTDYHHHKWMKIVDIGNKDFNIYSTINNIINKLDYTFLLFGELLSSVVALPQYMHLIGYVMQTKLP